jgi:hypothetical protein
VLDAVDVVLGAEEGAEVEHWEVGLGWGWVGTKMWGVGVTLMIPVLLVRLSNHRKVFPAYRLPSALR